MSLFDNADWTCDVTAISGGGKDEWGAPRPETETTITDCLLAPGTSDNPDDFRSFVTDEAVLYARPSASFRDVRRVITPDDSPLPGRWIVDGSPVRWPFGWAVPLLREGTNRVSAG